MGAYTDIYICTLSRLKCTLRGVFCTKLCIFEYSREKAPQTAIYTIPEPSSARHPASSLRDALARHLARHLAGYLVSS